MCETRCVRNGKQKDNGRCMKAGGGVFDVMTKESGMERGDSKRGKEPEALFNTVVYGLSRREMMVFRPNTRSMTWALCQSNNLYDFSRV